MLSHTCGKDSRNHRSKWDSKLSRIDRVAPNLLNYSLSWHLLSVSPGQRVLGTSPGGECISQILAQSCRGGDRCLAQVVQSVLDMPAWESLRKETYCYEHDLEGDAKYDSVSRKPYIS